MNEVEASPYRIASANRYWSKSSEALDLELVERMHLWSDNSIHPWAVFLKDGARVRYTKKLGDLLFAAWKSYRGIV